MLWVAAQMIGTRAVNLGGQIVLAWLLEPQHFGLLAMAQTVTVFASTFQQAGLQYVLIQRQKHFHRWSTPAFWMGVASSLLAAGLILGMAPIAGLAYESPQLPWLLGLLALAPPIQMLGMLPTTRLRIDLRFRELTVADWLGVVVNMATTIVCAAWGMGAFSFAYGILAGSVLRTGLVSLAAPTRVRWIWRLRRWRYLIGDTGFMIGSALLQNLMFQGDYIVLGLLATETVVGIYFFAFRLSTQALQLLSVSLAGVLFPALAKLQDTPHRQVRAFLESSRVLMMIAAPVCLTLVPLSGPMVRLLFRDEYLPSIPVLQVLCLGMAFRCLYPPAFSLLRAQGRFRAHFWLSGLVGVWFCGAVTVGAWMGEAVGVAWAATLTLCAFGPILLYWAIRPIGSWRDAVGVHVRPTLAAGAAAAVATGAVGLVPDGSGHDLLRMAVVLLVVPTVYLPLIRWLWPQTWRQAKARAQSVLPARFGRRHAQTIDPRGPA